MIKINNPMDSGYKKRTQLYHILTHLIGSVVPFIILVTDTAGVSTVGLCLVKQYSWANVFIFTPLAVYYPFSFGIFGFALYIIKDSQSSSLKKFLIKHSLFLFLYTLFVMPLTLAIVFENYLDYRNESFVTVSMALSSSAGLLINTMRLSDPAFTNFVRRKLGFNDFDARSTVYDILNERKDSGVSLQEGRYINIDRTYESDYTQIFSGMYDKAVMNSIISLRYIFSNEIRIENQRDYKIVLP